MGWFETSLRVPAWNRTLRVVIYRKPVPYQSQKHYQLDLFDLDNGHFEYSAVTTNTDLCASALWNFLAGRVAQEKTYGELKREWALDTVPTDHYSANSAWQQIAVLGHNLLRSSQLQTMALRKPKSRKRTFGFLLQSLKTIRYMLLHQPARLIRSQGYSVLRFSVSGPTREFIQSIHLKLAA